MPNIVGCELLDLADVCETQLNLFKQLDESIGNPKGIYDEDWARHTGAFLSNYQCENADDAYQIAAMIERKLECLRNVPLDSLDLRNIKFTPTPEICEFIETVSERRDEISGCKVVDTTHMDEVFHHMGLKFIPRSVTRSIIKNSLVPKEKACFYPQDMVMSVGEILCFNQKVTIVERLRLLYCARQASKN